MTQNETRPERGLTVHYPCKYVPAELLAGFGAGLLALHIRGRVI